MADFDPHSKQYEASYTLTRWFDDIQHDFATRLTWCCASRFEDANHAPQVGVAEGTDMTAALGETITLTARATDPDGDELTYDWQRYADADTCATDVALTADGATCQVELPADAQPGDTVHVIVRVRDVRPDDQPYMVSYARVVISVA